MVIFLSPFKTARDFPIGDDAVKFFLLPFGRVYSMERLKPLLVDAENRLRDLRISNISLRYGDGVKGWPEAAPFDRIILTCGSAKIPDILLQQLKIDGIMVAPEGTDSAQQLVVVTRRESGFEREVLMPVTFVPLIEGC